MTYGKRDGPCVLHAILWCLHLAASAGGTELGVPHLQWWYSLSGCFDDDIFKWWAPTSDWYGRHPEALLCWFWRHHPQRLLWAAAAPGWALGSVPQQSKRTLSWGASLSGSWSKGGMVTAAEVIPSLQCEVIPCLSPCPPPGRVSHTCPRDAGVQVWNSFHKTEHIWGWGRSNAFIRGENKY